MHSGIKNSLLLLFSPAVLTVLPGLDVHLAHALPHANVLGGGVVLQGTPEEGPAAEAGCGPVVNMAGRWFSTNLKGCNCRKVLIFLSSNAIG